jgi:hypothetical protein
MQESVLRHQMERSQSSRFKRNYAAKALMAFVLLAAFLSGVVPLAAVTAGSLCALECCAGKAPHASGSCMKGACQVTLPTSRARGHHAAPDKTEKFCGLSRKIRLTNFALRRAEARLSSSSDHVSPSALEAPCHADCGCSGFANSNRSRNSAADASDSRPRLATNNYLGNFRNRRIRILQTQCRQGAPRGPPISFHLV